VIVEGLVPLAVPMKELKLMPGNPRRGNVDAVAKSLEMFGQRKPIVALKDGTVIAGNHTLQAAAKLKWDRIAVVWVDDDDATAKAFSLADNRTAELGGYDESLLAELIAEVQEADEALLAATAWSADDLKDLLDRLEPEPPELQGNPDDVPDPPPAKTVSGDVWLLGDHRVMCGDSTSPTDVERLMDGGEADIVWTDPPYGVSYVGKTADALTIDNDGAEGLDELLSGAFDSVLIATKPGRPVYIAAPAGPQGVPFANALLERGLFRQRLCWVKSVLVLGHSDYHYRHEDIYLGYTPGGAGRRGRGGKCWYGDNAQTSVLEFDKPSRNAEHPTMKPVELISYMLRNSSGNGDVVLDLFGGSGSTLIAAHSIGRKARLMELDPRYVDVVCRRYQELTGEKPVSEATGNPHDFTDAT
jgi:site-specific DNA-methyltransferase (adenine-specific)